MSKIPYNHKAIEKKWRENWEKNPVNVKVDENGKERQKYLMFFTFSAVEIAGCTPILMA